MSIDDEINQLLNNMVKETPRQQHFRNLFFNDKESLSIKKFYEKLEKSGKNQEKIQKNTYTLPTFLTLETWSAKNKWIPSKKKYQELQNKKIADILKDEYIKDSLKIFKLNQDIRRKALEKAKELLDLPLHAERGSPTYSGYHFEKTMMGVKAASDENRLESGNPTEIIRSENKNTNTNIKVDKTDEIEEILSANEDMSDEELLDWLDYGSNEFKSGESDSE